MHKKCIRSRNNYERYLHSAVFQTLKTFVNVRIDNQHFLNFRLKNRTYVDCSSAQNTRLIIIFPLET